MLENEFFRNVPEYYPYMYLHGFTPEQIMYARKKQKEMKATFLEDEIKATLELAIDEILNSWK